MRASRNRLGTVALMASLAATLGAAVWAQVGGLDVIRGFKNLEFYEEGGTTRTNRLKSLISGAEARPLGSNWWVSRMKIEAYDPDGRTNLVAWAPECLFDPRSQVASSTGRLELTASDGRFFVEGQGFLCRRTNFHLIISNRVRTVIHHQLFSSTPP
jgi:hypothetical protein